MSRKRRRIRRALWLAPTITLIVSSIIFVTSLIGTSDKHLNRVVGWVTILTMFISVLTLVAQVISWLRPSRSITPTALDEYAQTLAEKVFITEDRNLRQLVGGDEIAQVRFEPNNVESSPTEGFLTRLREIVRFVDGTGDEVGDISTIAEYFRSLALPRMTVLGPPGSGKTIMLISLVVQLLRDSQSRSIVPVRMELAGFDPLADNFTNWIAGRISTLYRTPEPIALKLVETGRILPVLDGLDEMDASNGTPERANMTLIMIDRYIAGAELGVVLASRVANWQNVLPNISSKINCSVIYIQPLKIAQIGRYVQGRLGGEPEIDAAWISLLKRLEQKKNSYIVDVLSRPLWLYLAVLEFRSNPSGLLLLTDSDHLRERLIGGFVSAASKEPLKRIKSVEHRYQEDLVLRWLRELARFTDMSPVGSSERADIIPDRLWLMAGAFRVRLIHAVLASIMGGLTLLVIWPALDEVISSFSSILHGHDQGLITSLIIIGIWLTFNLLRSSTDVSTPPLSIRIRFQGIRALRPTPQTIITWFRQTLRQSFIDGYRGKLLLSFLLSLPAAFYILAVRFEPSKVLISLLMIVVLYITFSFFNLIIAILVSPFQALVNMTSQQPIRPYDTLRRDRYLWIGCVLIIPIFAAATPPFSWSSIIDSSLLGSLLATLIARAFIRYTIAICLESISGRSPLRLQSFLNWAVRAGLLREAGPSFQFRHVELQRWLTLSDTSAHEPYSRTS